MTINNNGRPPHQVQPPVIDLRPDLDEIKRALTILVPEGSIAELRALSPGGIKSGYFENLDCLAQAAYDLSADGAHGIYMTANPVKREYAETRGDFNEVKLANGVGSTTSKEGIVRRARLLVDLDPFRPRGQPSTEEERNKAVCRAQQIAETLKEAGWPEPLVTSSGNGAHLVYGLDLPVDDDGRVKGALVTLAEMFSGEGIELDLKVYDPARLVKLPGTVVRKGVASFDRPHRVAQILSAPEKLMTVTVAQIDALIAGRKTAEVPAGDPPAPGAATASIPTDDLARAWNAITDPSIFPAFIEKWVGSRCTYADEKTGRLHGPCPCMEGHEHKCSDDPIALTIYSNRGEPYAPKMFCRHRDSCGLNTNLFEVIKQKVGSAAEAARVIKLEAGLDPEKDGGKKPARRQQLAAFVKERLRKATLFCDLSGKPYVEVESNGAVEIIELASEPDSKFRIWITGQYDKATGEVLPGEGFGDIVGMLKARAYEGPQVELFVRVGHLDGKAYIDLGRRDGKTIEVSDKGWEIIERSPVKFRRPMGTFELPIPKRNGSIEDLWRIVHIPDKDDGSSSRASWWLPSRHGRPSRSWSSKASRVRRNRSRRGSSARWSIPVTVRGVPCPATCRTSPSRRIRRGCSTSRTCRA